MGFDRTGRLPEGWRWTRRDPDRIELDRTDGPNLLGERTDRGSDWRLIYRIERGESVVIDTFGAVSGGTDPVAFLADVARYIEDHDLQEDYLGELLVVEGETIRCREWRIE